MPGREWPSSVQEKSCFDYFLAVTHSLCSLPIELLRNKKGILRRKRLKCSRLIGKRKTRSYQKLPPFLLCGISTGYVHLICCSVTRATPSLIDRHLTPVVSGTRKTVDSRKRLRCGNPWEISVRPRQPAAGPSQRAALATKKGL